MVYGVFEAKSIAVQKVVTPSEKIVRKKTFRRKSGHAEVCRTRQKTPPAAAPGACDSVGVIRPLTVPGRRPACQHFAQTLPAQSFENGSRSDGRGIVRHSRSSSAGPRTESLLTDVLAFIDRYSLHVFASPHLYGWMKSCVRWTDWLTE